MDVRIEDPSWDAMSYSEKNHRLYLRQKELLDLLLERGAISQTQHDRSLSDLTAGMGESG